MATLLFAKEFLDDFVKLEPPVRQKVRELPGKFEDATPVSYTHSGASWLDRRVPRNDVRALRGRGLQDTHRVSLG